LFTKCGLKEFVGDMGMFAGLVAAIIHDYNHPGFTNQFLVNSDSDLATTYSDQSVLENYHLAQAFSILKQKEYNIFSGISRELYREIKEMIVQMVLATDMTKHYKILGEFKSKLAAGGLNPDSNEDRLTVLAMGIKCADLGHTTKKTLLHLDWCARITLEFYHQGDEEKKLQIPLSPFMDRNTSNVPKTEYGFLNYLVLPLYEGLVQKFPAASMFLEQLKANIEHWQRELQSKGSFVK